MVSKKNFTASIITLYPESATANMLFFRIKCASSSNYSQRACNLLLRIRNEFVIRLRYFEYEVEFELAFSFYDHDFGR